MDEDKKFIYESSEYKLKETLSFLLCLTTEGIIEQDTYNLLYNNILYVLNKAIQDELYKDMEE